jgi:hypothetical protein
MDNLSPKPLKIKKVGRSYDIRLNPAFAKANNLRDGDYVVIGKMRIIRAEDFELLGRDLEIAE